MSTERPAVITEASELGTVLGIWAHPDDEVYLSGGLMAAAAAGGQRVVCVTATLGEHGTAHPDRWPPARLAGVRAAELRASLAALGVAEHHQLGLPDGGCGEQPSEAVTERLSAIIDEVRPDTILTFGPDGFTGHGDHQVVSRWATAARAQAAPGAALFYATATDQFIDRWQDIYDRLRIFLTDDVPVRTPVDALAVDLRLDPHLADLKLTALRAQATQTAELVELLGESTVLEWCCSVESFIAAERWAAQGGERAQRPSAVG